MSWHDVSKMQPLPASAKCSQDAQVPNKNVYLTEQYTLKRLCHERGTWGRSVMISLNSSTLCVVASRVETTALFLSCIQISCAQVSVFF